MPKKLYLIVSLVILLLAGALRFYKLGQVPVSLYWDETAMLVDARAISQTGKDMHGNSMRQAIFPSYGDYKLPAYIWLAGLTIKLFGASDWSLRLPSSIAGILSVVLIGLIANYLFSELKQKRKLSILSMLVMAFTPWSIMFSRTGFEGHVGQFFLGSAVLLTLISIKKNKYKYLLLGQLLAAVATYTYFSVRFVWPVIYIALIILFTKLELKKIITLLLQKLVIPLTIFILLLLPMFKSPLYEDSNMFRLSTTSVLNSDNWALISNQYKEIAGNTLLDKLIYHRYILIGRELIKNYSDNLAINFLFISGDPNLRHGTGEHGLFLLLFLLFFLLGLYSIAKRYPRQAVFLIIWWLSALLPASVPQATPHALRSLNALLPIALIIGFGFYCFVELIINSKNKVIKLSYIFYLLLLGLNAWQFIYHYFGYYPIASSSSFQDGYKQLTAVINKYNIDARNVYVKSFDGRFFLWPLAYGSKEIKDYNSLEFEKYDLKNADNIVFKEFDYFQLDSLDHKVIIIDEALELENLIDKYQIQPDWQEYSADSFGNKKFMIIGLGN